MAELRGIRRDTVLVVDDTPESLGFLTDTLDGAGYTVLIATDGESALRLVEQIKGQAEQAAAAQGVSLNSWVAQAVQGALSGQLGRGQRGRWGGRPGDGGQWGSGSDRPGGPDDGRNLRGWVEG